MFAGRCTTAPFFPGEYDLDSPGLLSGAGYPV